MTIRLSGIESVDDAKHSFQRTRSEDTRGKFRDRSREKLKEVQIWTTIAVNMLGTKYQNEKI